MITEEQDLENRITTLKTFRYRSEKAYEGYGNIANVGYQKSKITEIYYDGTLLWNRSINLKKCEN